MRLLGKYVVMEDEETTFFTWRIRNARLAVIFCFFQLFVSCTSLAQHVYSVVEYRTIFSCQFNASFRNDSGVFLAYDIAIYDFGLFNFLLGTDECVANYLDGGYMRCLWCLAQTGALCLVLLAVFAKITWPYIMCPILIQQSVYALGLIILTIATLPKLLNAFATKFGFRFIKLIAIYWLGMMLTWMFTFTVWHYYWYLERLEKEAKGPSKKDGKLISSFRDDEVATLKEERKIYEQKFTVLDNDEFSY